MGSVHLKIRLNKMGFGLKRDCVMNVRDLHHEYGGSCILKVTFFMEKFLRT